MEHPVHATTLPRPYQIGPLAQGDRFHAVLSDFAAACPLHLVPGGYEMRALGLEAQCVLLAYSGCKRHWDPTGTPTRLDRDRLLELVA